MNKVIFVHLFILWSSRLFLFICLHPAFYLVLNLDTRTEQEEIKSHLLINWLDLEKLVCLRTFQYLLVLYACILWLCIHAYVHRFCIHVCTGVCVFKYVQCTPLIVSIDLFLKCTPLQFVSSTAAALCATR